MELYDDKNLFSTFLNHEQMESINDVIEQDFAGISGLTVLLTDKAGNIVAKHDERFHCDLCTLAAFGSINTATADILAQSIGEKEFPVRFFQGKKNCTHFNKVNDDFLLIAVSDAKIPTALLGMKIEKAVGKMRAVLENLKDAFLRLSFPVNFAGEAGRL